MAWIATLTPANELPVRMAFARCNPWCREDSAWQRRIHHLQAKLVKSPADQAGFDARAAEMACDMEAALREIEAQIAAAPSNPAEPPADKER
ncbi:MAG TPA: hypothetical protein VKV32_13370 [Stellaceae bacterium]|nr:hypothetical protein [Stellaceae bacterium]